MANRYHDKTDYTLSLLETLSPTNHHHPLLTTCHLVTWVSSLMSFLTLHLCLNLNRKFTLSDSSISIKGNQRRVCWSEIANISLQPTHVHKAARKTIDRFDKSLFKAEYNDWFRASRLRVTKVVSQSEERENTRSSVHEGEYRES